MCPTASLAFRQPKGHPTPSVFYADQRGVEEFLILTLGPELWGHPHPHGEPQHQQCQGLLLGAHFIEQLLLGIIKLVI